MRYRPSTGTVYYCLVAKAQEHQFWKMEGTMYGTIFRMQPKIGTEDEVVRLMEQWNRDRGSKVQGFVSSNLVRLDNGGMMSTAIFESKEKYDANASDPEQDRWYRRLRELLESDPEWNDGEVILSYT